MVAAVDDDVSFVPTTSSSTASAIATGAEGGATRKLVSMLSRKDKRATAIKQTAVETKLFFEDQHGTINKSSISVAHQREALYVIIV